jgi:hypothetical protein
VTECAFATDLKGLVNRERVLLVVGVPMVDAPSADRYRVVNLQFLIGNWTEDWTKDCRGFKSLPASFMPGDQRH